MRDQRVVDTGLCQMLKTYKVFYHLTQVIIFGNPLRTLNEIPDKIQTSYSCKNSWLRLHESAHSKTLSLTSEVFAVVRNVYDCIVKIVEKRAARKLCKMDQ